jgi:hypothetical protein
MRKSASKWPSLSCRCSARAGFEKKVIFFAKTGCGGSLSAGYVALFMPKTPPLPPRFIAISACSLLFATAAHGQIVESAKSRFIFKDADGKTDSAEVVTKYIPKKIVRPVAKMDASIDPKLRRAATIAEERAHAHSRERCWHYVKEALFASGAVSSYPKTVNAKDAAKELVSSYGFKKLSVRDPYKAPVGSVLVYNNKKGAGHVEIRTKSGFASDFRSKIPSPRPLIGVYTKS